jgi:phytoene/squalene synthetase
LIFPGIELGRETIARHSKSFALASRLLESSCRDDGAEPPKEPLPAVFREVALRRGIPREYPEELLLGMQMDVADSRYARLDDLVLYCYRVAGVVGLMMCHVMGVRHGQALRHAAHLGMDRFYQSGDEGLKFLNWRTALAVRTAKLFYSRIGAVVARRGYDVHARRAYVASRHKLLLVLSAAAQAPGDLYQDLRRGFCPVPLTSVIRFPADVMPV